MQTLVVNLLEREFLVSCSRHGHILSSINNTMSAEVAHMPEDGWEVHYIVDVRTNEVVPLNSPVGKQLIAAGLYQSLHRTATIDLEEYRDVQTYFAMNEPLDPPDDV